MNVVRKILVACLIFSVMISGFVVPTVTFGATNYVTATKSVNPTTITPDGEAEVTLSIKGSPPVNVVKPNDVILIIDKSGSMMSENRINAAKNAAKGFIDLMDFSKHRVGIVDFSSPELTKTFPLTADASSAKAYIDTIQANGGTATGDAIEKAIALLENHRPEAQPVIVILTDGDATIPSDNPYQYAKDMAARAKNAGIVFYTIALLGANENPDTSKPNLLLKEMATTAHHHHFVLGSTGLSEIYAAIVKEIGMASAYDVVITDNVAPEFEIVPGSYDQNIPKPEVVGNTLKWTFLELKDDTLTFTYKIKPKQGAPLGTLPISTSSRITYKDYAGADMSFLIPTVRIEVKHPAPVITSLVNDNGHINGGETVTINGDHFRQGVTVKFGTTTATNVQFISKNQITVTAPPGPQGMTTVTVQNDDGQKATAPYRYYAIPEVTSISPASGPLAGGNFVTIYGKNFMWGITAKFGNSYGTVTQYDGYIRVKVPAGIAPGPVDVQLENPDGTNVVVTGGYTYQEDPLSKVEVTSVNPNSGLVTGGEYVYLSGKNFQSGLKVYFGTNEAVVTNYYSTDSIKVKTPASTQAGPVDVKVVNPNGKEGLLANGFTYKELPPKAAPEVTSVSPNSGQQAGGETVYVNGKNFEPGLKVFFGTNQAQVLSFLSDSEVKVKAPQSALVGAVDVVVENPDQQTGRLAGGYTYNEPEKKPAPTITSLTPSTGLTSGGTFVYLTGTNIEVGATVTFGTNTVNVTTFFDSTQVKVKTPPSANGAGAVDVTITNPDGQSFTLPQGFTYQDPQVKITSINPNSGPITGGTSVYVTGENFDPNLTITVGGKQVPVDYYYGSTQFKFKVPSTTTVGPVDLVVTNPSGQSASTTFTYTEPPSAPIPTLTKVNPAYAGVKGGTYVYIEGTNLDGVTISFGGVVVKPTTVFSSKEIKVRVPAAATPGVVELKAINVDGKESNAIPFEYR
jgi:uncharacterized protein YegL